FLLAFRNIKHELVTYKNFGCYFATVLSGMHPLGCPGSRSHAISERPPHLHAQDPRIGIVVADEAPTWNGGCRLLIHEVARRVLEENVCEAEVERGIWGERPLCAGRKPGAIFVRQARGTECVLHGRFVEREAPAEFPLRRQLIVGAKP